jgi:hypothetical protein
MCENSRINLSEKLEPVHVKIHNEGVPIELNQTRQVIAPSSVDSVRSAIVDQHGEKPIASSELVQAVQKPPYRKLDAVKPLLNCTHSVDGILELIRHSKVPPASKLKVKSEYILCNPPCLHVSQKGAYGAGWSCGYRNIQMLCSSLMRIEEYRRVMFDGSGVVPEISALQRWIETAWKAGFDQVVGSVPSVWLL